MKKRPLHLKLLQFHRWIGLAASLLVLLLAISGIALEHSEQLRLDQRYLTQPWVLNHYGIKPDSITQYRVKDYSLAHAGNRIYLDGVPTAVESSLLCGAVKIAMGFAICLGEGLALIDAEGALVEHLETDLSLPAPATGIGQTSSQQVVLLSHDGNWLADSDFLLWQPYPDQPSIVSQSSAPAAALRYKIEAHNISHEISWERVLLDLHSGRLLGSWGVYLMDLAALAMIFLACSGVWVWWKRSFR